MLKFPGTGTTLLLAITRGIRHRKDTITITTNASPDAPAGAPNIVDLRKDAWADVRDSFEKFRLSCWIEVLHGMMEKDVAELAGERHERATDKPGYRWGSTLSRLDFHGGEAPLDRPRVRNKNAGKEIPPTTWEHL